ncbi:MAG: hypothetical protein ACNA8L_07405 [Luteolibacter sp.]|jgi:hypothetical protein
MRLVLASAGLYHLLFALWVNAWPHLWFDWMGLEHPNHPMLWRGVGLLAGVLGIGLLIAARNPIRNWLIVLVGFVKTITSIGAISLAMVQGTLPMAAIWVVIIDDLIWIFPLGRILWASLQAHAGIPPSRRTPFSIEEASGQYFLSNGKSLDEASRGHTLALVFLRHFGCTFTRQILRSLEEMQRVARQRNATLVLVHMLQSGQETQYLGDHSDVPRIADPRCELYRAFGLGKGGFLELFGPRVWWRGAIALFRGCGVGHLAGDGLQMPGAFLYRDGRVLTSQRAHSAAELPDLPDLFGGLHGNPEHDKLSA